MDASLKKHSGEKGQALFEFLIFLPFTFVMLTIFITMGNSINGAINQQKITRGYFYYDLKNNSMAPTAKRLLSWSETSHLNRISMNMIGWKLMSDASGRYPVSACYKLNPLIAANSDETCADSTEAKGAENPSSYVRIYTVYGMCSTPYQIMDTGGIRVDNEAWQSCMLKKGQ